MRHLGDGFVTATNSAGQLCGDEGVALLNGATSGKSGYDACAHPNLSRSKIASISPASTMSSTCIVLLANLRVFSPAKVELGGSRC